MQLQGEQERRRELLLKVLEGCPDPKDALAIAVHMEKFIVGGAAPCERQGEATPEATPAPSQNSRSNCRRPRWTDDDVAKLRQLLQDDQAIETISNELQKTPASIYSKMRRLELSPSTAKKKPKLVAASSSSKKRAIQPYPPGPKAIETVGIESVVHFLRTRDYTVVPTNDGCYRLDGRGVYSAQELFVRANKMRGQLGQPTWDLLEGTPRVYAS